MAGLIRPGGRRVFRCESIFYSAAWMYYIRRQSAGEILDNILSEVQQFSCRRPADDMTLIVAACS